MIDICLTFVIGQQSLARSLKIPMMLSLRSGTKTLEVLFYRALGGSVIIVVIEPRCSENAENFFRFAMRISLYCPLAKANYIRIKRS